MQGRELLSITDGQARQLFLRLRAEHQLDDFDRPLRAGQMDGSGQIVLLCAQKSARSETQVHRLDIARVDGGMQRDIPLSIVILHHGVPLQAQRFLAPLQQSLECVGRSVFGCLVNRVRTIVASNLDAALYLTQLQEETSTQLPEMQSFKILLTSTRAQSA